jgi:hypothetical protein
VTYDFLVIAIYLGSVTYLLRYLRRAYPMLWVDLGEPTLPWTFSEKRTLTNPLGSSRDGGFAMLRFVFSNQYKNVADSKLANLILVARVSFIASIAMLIIFIAR